MIVREHGPRRRHTNRETGKTSRLVLGGHDLTKANKLHEGWGYVNGRQSSRSLAAVTI